MAFPFLAAAGAAGGSGALPKPSELTQMGAAPILGPLSVAMGIGSLVRSQKQSAYDRYIERKLAELQRQKETTGLGLTPQQLAARQASYLNPVRTAGAQQQNRQEAMRAAAGETSGGAIGNMQQQRSRSIGEAVMSAQQKIAGEHEARASEQALDLESYTAAIENRRLGREAALQANMGAIVGGVGQMLGVPGGMGGGGAQQPSVGGQVRALTQSGNMTSQQASLLQQLPYEDQVRVLQWIESGGSQGQLTVPGQPVMGTPSSYAGPGQAVV